MALAQAALPSRGSRQPLRLSRLSRLAQTACFMALATAAFRLPQIVAFCSRGSGLRQIKYHYFEESPLQITFKTQFVLQFLKNHGFSNTQIANIASKHLSILLTNPKKTLLPKLEFLKQIGFSKDDIAHFLSKDHTFLRRGLERKIKPAYENLKDLLGSEEKVTAAIKSSCSS
ncbi:hypothetical protein Syun_014462 [Stephania yunnanensis]|uniref:Uncharacterized protein n=1 Tax=Stephania yunnanensis TaxID=152371 RepID=A0AAP0JJK6_9MAGN